jgi:hypothetical protein
VRRERRGRARKRKDEQKRTYLILGAWKARCAPYVMTAGMKRATVVAAVWVGKDSSQERGRWRVVRI